MNFYLLLWKIIIFLLILLAINTLFDSKQSLSYFRIILFSLIPIILAIFAYFIKKKNNIIILTNSLFIFFLFLSIYEIYLINNLNKEIIIKNDNLNNKVENYHTCGSSFIRVKNLTIYPVGGVSKKDIKFTNQENLSFSYRMNDRYGFNNEDSIWDKKKINSVFIGDSFTYGADVNYNENFVEIYKKSTGSGLNLGCGGNGPLLELATFEEYVKNLKINPKYLFWVYYSGNDLGKDIENEKKSFYRNYLENNFTQNLSLEQNQIDQIIKEHEEKFDSNNVEKIKISNNTNKIKINKNFLFKYTNTFKFYNIRSRLGFSKSYTKENFETFKYIIKNVNSDMNSWDGKLIFIFIPSQSRYSNLTSYYEEFFYDLPIKEFLNKNNIKYLDLNDKFKEHPDPKIFYNGHLNVKGNQILSNYIIKEKFF